MSILIGCDSFLALRNVRNGNLGKLFHDEKVIVWVDPNQLRGSQVVKPDGIELGCLEDFDFLKDAHLQKSLRRAGFARRSYIDPASRWVTFLVSSHQRNGHNLFRRSISVSWAAARLAGYWMAGSVGLAQPWHKKTTRILRNHSVTRSYQKRIKESGATVVAGFSPDGNREMALIESANSLGIPTAVMIRSRDNLIASIRYLPQATAYFVWSNSTRQFLKRMYPEIPSDQIYVTGSPQFDRHFNPQYRLQREDFFSLIGLDPNRPLIVYTMATPELIEHEIEIAQHLADAAHAGAFVRGAQLLVRGHPRMFGSATQLLHQEYPEARCYPRPTKVAYRSPEHEAQVVCHILEDEPVHLATLAYQDVQVNVCGTMTIDSAILDKPTINIYYDLVRNILPGMSVLRFYKRSDVKQMLAYGCSRLARNPEECIHLVNRYLENPSLDAEGRKRAREEDCGPLDGGAGKRIANCLQNLAQGHHTVAI